MGYVFEWDSWKAATNARKHGVTFDDATTVFGEMHGLLMADIDHSADEARYLLLGLSTRHRLLVVAFVERTPRTRLISARRANWSERKRYEEKN